MSLDAWLKLRSVGGPDNSTVSRPAPEAPAAGPTQEPVAWIVKWRTKHTPKNVSAYIKEDDARRAAVNVERYADASDVTVTPAYSLPRPDRGEVS